MLTHNNDLLVMTVCNEQSIPWLDLQKFYLSKTTTWYDHAVFLNDVDFETDSIIVGRASGIEGQQEQHLYGLESLLNYARTHSYNSYLVLDSDCFPIKKGWNQILMKKLLKYDACSIVRAENCTIFPHPSASFFNNLDKVSFGVDYHFDLRGLPVADTTCSAERVFPLLRTNRINPNLLAAGIYYDMFYHHGCGSRNFNMRTMPQGELHYYDDIGQDPIELREELFRDPDRFINWLLGMNIK